MKVGDFVCITQWAGEPCGRLWAVITRYRAGGVIADIKFIPNVGKFECASYTRDAIYDDDPWELERHCDKWRVYKRVPNYVLAAYTRACLLGELTSEGE